MVECVGVLDCRSLASIPNWSPSYGGHSSSSDSICMACKAPLHQLNLVTLRSKMDPA